MRAVLAGAALLLLTTAFASFFSWSRSHPDVDAYFFAARQILGGESPYGPEPARETDRAFLYPPAFAALLAPLALLPPLWGYASWMALHALWLRGALVRLEALGHARAWARDRQRLVLAAALLLPAIAEIQEGQSNLLTLWAMAAGLCSLEAGRTGWGGALLALAAHVKAFPAILVPVLLLQRRRAAARAMCGWLFALCLLPLVWTVPARGLSGGFRATVGMHAEFLSRVVAPALREGRVRGFEQSYATNNSVRAVLRRLFGEGVRFSPLPGHELRRGPLLTAAPGRAIDAAAATCSLVMVAGALWFARRSRHDPLGRVTGAGVAVIAASLGGLISWEHHLLLLALVLAPLVARSAELAAWAALPLALSLTLPYLVALGGWPHLLLISREWGVALFASLLLCGAAVWSWRDARAPGTILAVPPGPCATLPADNKI